MMSYTTKLKIGAFSQMMQVTVKTLRHYEQKGILLPHEVDEFTGYRYYTLEQMQRLNNIRFLQRLGFSLDEIKELLDDVSHDPDVDRLNRKIEETDKLLRQLIDRRAHLLNWRNAIKEINTMEKFVEFLKNTKEIYGDMPEELVNLAKIGFIKNMCGVLHASKIVIKDNCNIVLDSKESLTKELVAGTVDEYSEYINFNFADLPTIIISNVPKGQMLDFLIAYLQFVTCNC